MKVLRKGLNFFGSKFLVCRNRILKAVKVNLSRKKLVCMEQKEKDHHPEEVSQQEHTAHQEHMEEAQLETILETIVHHVLIAVRSLTVFFQRVQSDSH